MLWMLCCYVIVFVDDLPRRRPPSIYKPPTAEMIAYLDFSVSTTGMLTGVKVLLSILLLGLLSHSMTDEMKQETKVESELPNIVFFSYQ